MVAFPTRATNDATDSAPAGQAQATPRRVAAELTPCELPRADLPAAIARSILEHIQRNDLRPGDRLPTMQALADRFAVANPTVREALRRLQATGAVELRQGSGTYVGRGRGQLVLANPHVTSLEMGELLYVLDARLVIEPYLAGQAAACADIADVAELEVLLLDTERHIFPNDSAVDRINNDFHRAVARIAREPVLAHVDFALLDLYGSGYCAAFHPSRGRPRDLHDHIGVFHAIRANDSALASTRMRDHLLAARRDVEGRIGEGLERSVEVAP